MTAAPRKRVPASAPKPQDRKPKKTAATKAREAEAEDGYVTVEQCGVKLRVPIGGKVPLEAYVAFTEGDELGGTRLLLGEDQWAKFLAAKPTLDDFNEVGRQLDEAVGN